MKFRDFKALSCVRSTKWSFSEAADTVYGTYWNYWPESDCPPVQFASGHLDLELVPGFLPSLGNQRICNAKGDNIKLNHRR